MSRSFDDMVELFADSRREHVILRDAQSGRRALLSPELVGRVMTMAWGGGLAPYLGWINEHAVATGTREGEWVNVGGVERLWLAPEGGPFGLQFGSGPQTLQTYRVQKPLGWQPFDLLGVAPDQRSATMRSNMELVNRLGRVIQLEVTRTVELLDSCTYALGLSDRLNWVGTESRTTIRNRARTALEPNTGTVAAWTISMQPCSSHQWVILPYRAHADAGPSPIIREDYVPFLTPGGKLPPGQCQILPAAVMMKAHGDVQTKVGLDNRRARDRIGSLDLDRNHLVLNSFDHYPDMTYVTSYFGWDDPLTAYQGDVVSTYVQGPQEGQPGAFFELETLSPSLALRPGESFTFRNRLFHLEGEATAIDTLLSRFLGVGRADIVRCAEIRMSRQDPTQI